MHDKTRNGRMMVLAALLATACAEPRASTPYAASGDPYGATPDYGQASSGGSAAPAASATPTQTVAANADVATASSAAFQMYFADGLGRALYMFANDVPGSNTSACAGACLEKWPTFDVKNIQVGNGLTATDFTRFQRADGAWQTSFKGHPLYRFASDAAHTVTGDGMGGRWFVARDYFAFVAAKPELTPQGASMPAPYLTNRAGRTVYVFMNDTAANSGAAPVSACVDKCLDAWPAWNAPAILGTPVLPSSMNRSDFAQFERVVAGATIKQLTYRGWPLYFHTPDAAPGDTTGHMTGAWRAIDPLAFPMIQR